MNAIRKFLTTAAIVVAGGIAPSFAATQKAPVTSVPQKMMPAVSAYKSELQESGKMLGEIGSARLLLDLGMTKDAQNHIIDARKIADNLEKNAPEIITHDLFKMGKTTYSHNGESKAYMIPVVDDVLTVKDFDVLMRSKQQAKVDEIDSNIVRYKMSMNIHDARKFLAEAEVKAASNDAAGALKALDGVYKGAFIEEIGYNDPLMAVHDNLVLAYNQSLHKNYGEARFALEHAKIELNNFEKTDENAKHMENVKKMSQEIATLQDELRRDDPSLTQKVSMKIHDWMHEIGTWRHA